RQVQAGRLDRQVPAPAPRPRPPRRVDPPPMPPLPKAVARRAPRRESGPTAGRAARGGDPEHPVSPFGLPIPYALCGSNACLRGGAPADASGTARTLRGVPPLRPLGACWHGRGSYTYNELTTGCITIPRH